MDSNRFSGAWPALLSPNDSRGGINVPVLQTFTEHLIALDVDGFYLCGSTGEGIYSPITERKLIVETVVAQVDGRVPTIVHVGTPVASDAVALARHAQQIGADAISSIIPPNYTALETALNYFQLLSDAAPELPLLPYLLGLSLDAVTLMRHLLEVPTVAGTKYTGANLYEMEQILRLGSDDRPFGWTVFSGMDEQCVFAAMFQSHGNIGSTLNFMPGVYKAIHRLIAQGEWAEAVALQKRANRVTETAISFGFMGALYEMVKILGHDCGEPRLPNRPLNSGQRQTLRQELEALSWRELTGEIP